MKTLSSIALAAALTACVAPNELSTQQQLSAYEASAGQAVASFSVNRPVDGWADLGERHVAIWMSGNEAYLLDLATPCPDLDTAFSIALTQSGNRVASGFDGVIVRGPATTVRPDRCMISRIRPVDTDELEAREQEYKGLTMVERETLSVSDE